MAFKPSAAKKRGQRPPGNININSLMDILSIMLIFLLMSFSTEGNLNTSSDGLVIPKTIQKKKAKKAAQISVSKFNIYFNKKPVISTEAAEKQSDMILSPLRAEMEKEADRAEDLELRFGVEFTREVMIQADEKTSFSVLVKVVYTAGKSRFPNMRLLSTVAGEEEVFD